MKAGSKKTLQKITYGLVAVMVLALIFSFEKVSDAAAGIVGVPGDMINSIARTTLGVSVGLFLVTSGVAALAVPIVGVALIAIGIVLVSYALWPYFTRDQSAE